MSGTLGGLWQDLHCVLLLCFVLQALQQRQLLGCPALTDAVAFPLLLHFGLQDFLQR